MEVGALGFKPRTSKPPKPTKPDKDRTLIPKHVIPKACSLPKLSSLNFSRVKLHRHLIPVLVTTRFLPSLPEAYDILFR